MTDKKTYTLPDEEIKVAAAIQARLNSLKSQAFAHRSEMLAHEAAEREARTAMDKATAELKEYVHGCALRAGVSPAEWASAKLTLDFTTGQLTATESK